MNLANYLVAGNTIKQDKIVPKYKNVVGARPKGLCLSLTQWPSILTVDLAICFKNYKRDNIMTLKEFSDARKDEAYKYYDNALKKLKQNQYKLSLYPQKLELL